MGKFSFFRKERGRTTPAEVQIEVQCKNLLPITLNAA